MKILYSVLFLIILTGSPLEAKGPLPEFEKDYKEQVKPFLSKYCVECHGSNRQKGKIRLDTLASMTAEADILIGIKFSENPRG